MCISYGGAEPLGYLAAPSCAGPTLAVPDTKKKGDDTKEDDIGANDVWPAAASLGHASSWAARGWQVSMPGWRGHPAADMNELHGLDREGQV